MLKIGFAKRAGGIQVIRQRRHCICTAFRDPYGKKRSTYLSICSSICADLFPCFHAISYLIFSNPTRGTWTIVSLAIRRDGDFKLWGPSQICCILARWPVYRLRLRGWNNSCVECHYGRYNGMPSHWTRNFNQLCGILARRPTHRLRFF